jgi:tetratricopeptide (TPR) repeat protein
MLAQARDIATAIDDPALTALTHIQEGLVLGRVGDFHGSAAALGRVGEAEHFLEPAQRAALHINLGQTRVALGEVAGATRSLETATDIAAAEGLVDLEFKARHNLAYLAFVEGDLPRALALISAADAMDAAVARDRARVDQAEILLDAGLLDGARSALENALNTARSAGHRLEEGEISLRLARCDVLASDLGGARRHVRQAIAAYRTRQASDLVAEAELMRATIDVAEARDLPTVVATLARRSERRPAGTPDTSSDRAATRLEAEARLLLGDADGAERRLATLATEPAQTLAGALHEVLVRARLDLARGRVEGAAARLEAGNRVLAAHQFQSASLDVRAGMALHGRRLAALDVERALDAGDAGGVLTTVERWRAISQRINPVTAPADPELAEATRELRRLRRLLADEGEEAAPGLAAEVAALESRVAGREWTLAMGEGRAGSAPPVPAEEALAAASASASTVVEFFESGSHLFQIVVTATGADVVRLGEVSDVVALVTRLRRDLRARAAVAPGSPMAPVLERATGSSLALVDRALNPSGASDARVVLVPSGSLAGMPWSLMPSLRGRPVTVAPSLTRWVRGPSRSTSGADRMLAALYGPGLTRTAPEIRAVLAAWGSPTPGGLTAAPSEAVVDALASARVVHLAAHGTHEGQSPLFSSVRMADGPVFAHEFPHPVRAEHVVLSACDVGQFSTRPGDEPLGLATALLSLGATSVLAAVAPVADDVAHDAMVAYHRVLAAGADSAEAWARVVAAEPTAGVFCLYGSDWSSADVAGQAVR